MRMVEGEGGRGREGRPTTDSLNLYPSFLLFLGSFIISPPKKPLILMGIHFKHFCGDRKFDDRVISITRPLPCHSLINCL